MSTMLARAPEVQPEEPTPPSAPGPLDAGVISRVGRGWLPDVELASAPAAVGTASSAGRRATRQALPVAPGPRLPPSPRAVRPLPPPVARPAAPSPPSPAPPARPAPALPELAPWLATPKSPSPARAVPRPPALRAPALAPAGRAERPLGRRLVPLAVLGLAALLAVAFAAGLRLPLPGGSGSHGAAPAVARDSLAPTAVRREIPPAFLQLYMRIGRERDIDWRFLAAIGGQESDHGRNRAADRVNASGCIGPMQVGVGGDCGDLLRIWGTDGDGDGRIDPREPADAIATAARGLRQGMGAPATGGSWLEYHRAACAYYGACADARANYADDVMRRAESYGFPTAGG